MLYMSPQLIPTMPNHAWWFPPCCIMNGGQKIGQDTSPQPQGLRHCPISHGHHMMIAQPCTVSMCLCVGVQEDSSYRVYRGVHLWSCFLRRQCFGFSDFPFLQKDRIQMDNPWTWMQIKQVLTSRGDVPDE